MWCSVSEKLVVRIINDACFVGNSRDFGKNKELRPYFFFSLLKRTLII